jgi:predicted transposase/invertase (TIGR01784 family)
MTDKERQEYNNYQKTLHDQASAYESTYVVGKIEGMKEGLEQGIEQGEKRKAIEIAKNLSDVLDAKTISLKTGLTIQEIESIQR